MATTIKTKNSTTGSTAPTGLVQGELAVNITDKKLYVGDAVGNSVQIAGQGATNAAGGSNTQVQYNSSGALAGSSNMTFDGTTLTVNGLATTGTVTVGDASGDALTINSSAVSIPNGLNFDSNTFVIDATNNRVGVGVASPLAPLHVVGGFTNDLSGSSGLTSNIIANTGNSSYLIIKSASANTYGLRISANSADDVASISNYYSAALTFGTANTERMRITSAGNVGIGTSSPAYKLHISGSSPTLMVQDTGANASQAFIQATNSGNYFGCSTSGGTTQPMLFYVGTERMRLDSSGNLGLGVTPQAWRSGDRVFELAGSNTAHVVAYVNGLSSGTNYYVNSGGTITYAYTGQNATRYEQKTNGQHIWYTAPSGTAGNAITFTQAMTLDASGNLGIGTTNIGAKLTVDSTTAGLMASFNSTATNGGYITGYSSGTAVWDIGTAKQAFNTGTSTDFGINTRSGFLGFGTASTERMRIDSSGNLLVGSTSRNGALVTASTTGGSKDGFENIMAGNGSANIVTTRTSASGTNNVLYNVVNGSYAGGLTTTTTTFALVASSDQRLKQNIKDLDSQLNVLDQIKVREFEFIADPDNKVKGFIAQELYEVVPEAVNVGIDNEDGSMKQPWAINQTALIPILTKAIQEQQAIINDLKARIETLESK